MDQSLDYAWEKLFSSVSALAAGKGGIRERLYFAYHSGLQQIAVLHPIPDVRLAAKLKVIVDDLKAKGTLSARLDDMSEDDASRLAGEIVELFDDVKAEYTKEKMNRQ
jgi:hypothetical protein